MFFYLPDPNPTLILAYLFIEKKSHIYPLKIEQYFGNIHMILLFKVYNLILVDPTNTNFVLNFPNFLKFISSESRIRSRILTPAVLCI